MVRSVSFSSEAVSVFCHATRDFNIVHDVNYMHPKGKKVIVPGMLLLTDLLSDCWDKIFTDKTPDYVKVFFNSIVSEAEKVELHCRPLAGKDRHWQLTAMNGKDCFALHDQISYVCHKEERSLSTRKGILRTLPVDRQQIASFNDVLGLSSPWPSELLFSVAYASMALQKAIDYPESEVEYEINHLLDKTLNPNCVSPFYQSLEIEIGKEKLLTNLSGEMHYYIDFEREQPNKSYWANLICENQNHHIFSARYQMVAIPDRLIMRMAKSL